MSIGSTAVSAHCPSLREYFSVTNMKSMARGFIYDYETPKIVTIHSISIALMCRIIQLLILIYGILYLMIHKKGYQETDTSIISSITLKVKGIGYNQTTKNQTLVIDGAGSKFHRATVKRIDQFLFFDLKTDYIVPPQENNALFLMTNFIRTDQEHRRCAESIDEKQSACLDDDHCRAFGDFPKANGKWTGRCLKRNDSKSVIGRCELEGWCPVENDRNIPEPIFDALNFTIFVKNFIEFPRFKVIRKNIGANASYLRSCQYDSVKHKICPIFRVGTLLDIVEPDRKEQHLMLTLGGVIRVKIDWRCNLDISLDKCLPEYSFGRLDAPYKEESFSQGFNFRFASHWKNKNRSFRTLTKAFGLRFIISVSGEAGRFDVITLSLNIGSLIGILGLATFICDIIALYVHRQSDVYRQQKFQDVDLNLLHLETLNNLAVDMMSVESKPRNDDGLALSMINEPIDQAQSESSKRRKSLQNENFDKSISSKKSFDETLSTGSPPNSSVRPRKAPLSTTRSFPSSEDKTDLVFVEDEFHRVSNNVSANSTRKTTRPNGAESDFRSTPRIETFL